VLIGASTGNAAAGLAVNGSGPHAGLAVGLAGASLTTIVAWLGRRSLRRSGVTLAPQAEPVQ
jgi:uncharacterized membrane protein